MNPTPPSKEPPRRLAWLFKAAEVFLDGHLPQWRGDAGADGQLSVTLSTSPNGELVLATRGHATVRTITDKAITFPKQP